MTKIPNVDWSAINWSAMVIHNTTAREDNMRAVRDQFYECHANAVVDAKEQGSGAEAASRLDLGAQVPGVVGDPGTGNPHRKLGGSAVGALGASAMSRAYGVTQGTPAPPPTIEEIWPAPPWVLQSNWPAALEVTSEGERVVMASEFYIQPGEESAHGVGQMLYSQQEIDGYRQASIALAKQAMDRVMAANEELKRVCGVDRRYLEGDTECSDKDAIGLMAQWLAEDADLSADPEFSDQDVQHYYRTKAT